MWVLLDRGDAAIVPSPSYPIHIYGPLFAGADLRQVPMRSLADPDERDGLRRRLLRPPHHGLRHRLAEAARARHLLPAQPDRRVRRPRLHAARRRLLPRAGDDRRPRLRLRRRRLRRLPAAEHPAGRGRQGVRRRAVLDDQELLDGRLAVRLPARQRRGRAGARQAEELPRLRHVPAGADRRHGHDQRGPRLPEGGLRHLPEPPRRADRRARAHRLGRPQAGRVDVRVGADPRAVRRDGLGRVLLAGRPRLRRGARRPASASGPAARASCGSP